MISILSNHVPITDATSLSSAARKVLSWIQDGNRWLNSAIGDQNAHYRFDSEVSLINSILLGLYGSETFAPPHCDFSAAPQFLLGLNTSQLTTIDKQVTQTAQTADNKAYRELKNTLALVGQDQIASIRKMLHEWQLGQHVIFNTLSFQEMRQLSSLAQRVTDLDDQVISDAAKSFALSRSPTAGAFANLTQYAILVYESMLDAAKDKAKDEAKNEVRNEARDNSNKPASKAASKTAKSEKNATKQTVITQQQTSEFMTSYDRLSGFALKRLTSPQLHAPQTIDQAGAMLNQWGMHNRCVGFTDFPTALFELANQIDLTLLKSDEQLAQAIANFDKELIETQKVLQLQSPVLSQDARLWHYHSRPLPASNRENANTSFILAEDGTLTLNSYQK